MENSIEIKNLKKRFKDLVVLDGVSLNVKRGNVLALLGPNGAGKTTTVKILSTLVKPDSGKVTVNGFDVLTEPEKVRANIGLTGQYAAVDEYLTGRENLEMVGRLYRLGFADIKERVQELLTRFDLEEAADRSVKNYSGGMRRRIDLAMSLIASPPVLFLDEPTTGLDPRSRLTMWEIIKELAATDVTVLLTTQYMEEADFLADQVVVIDNGKVIAEGTTKDLKAQVGSDRLDLHFSPKIKLSQVQAVLTDEELFIDAKQKIISISTTDGANSVRKILR